MYTRWSNASLRRAIQITRNLSKVCKCLEVQMQLSRQDILQAKRDLDELKTKDDIPGALTMYHKYMALLDPYLQSYESNACPSLAGDEKVVY